MSATVPANSTQLAVRFVGTPTGTAGANDWVEVAGVQLELGSTATPFQRNGANIQAELAACQRYYIRFDRVGTDLALGMGLGRDANTIRANLPLPTTLRARPSAVEWGGTVYGFDGNTFVNATSITIAEASTSSGNIQLVQAGAVATYRPYQISLGGSGFIAFSAEL
jgi:hypothetical protein